MPATSIETHDSTIAYLQSVSEVVAAFGTDEQHGLRDEEVFHAAIEHAVAVVPGSGFFVGPPQHGFLRLNFSNQSEASIDVGMARLGRTLFDLQEASRSREVPSSLQ